MVAVNKKLWASCQAWAKRTYDVHPSAYSNSAAVKRYNKMGGKWRKPTSKSIKKSAMDITFDIKESDIMPPFSMDEAKLLVERMGIDINELGSSLKEFCKGLNTELEHKILTHGDPSDTATIVVDHLRENPKYYTLLSEMEGEDSGDAAEAKAPESEEDEIAMLADFFGVAHEQAVEELYNSMEEPSENVKIAKPLGGLGYWHKKEKWVDISRKDKSGKHPPCGRTDSSKGGKPRCRPASEAAKLSPSEKKKESDKKRRTERSKKRQGKKPHMVKFDYMHSKKKKAEDESMSFKKIATSLTEIATSIDSKGNAEAARAVDELTLRLVNMADQIAALPKVAEVSEKKSVSGLKVNNGHSISTYFSSQQLYQDLGAGKISKASIISAVADELYSSGMVDAQAELAVSADKFATAFKLASKGGLIR